MTTTVYKVTSNMTKFVYYGYARVEEANLLAAFLVGAQRKDTNSEERADVRFLQECSNDANTIVVTPLELFEEEFDALLARNEHRMSDCNSISGPTIWPYGDRVSEVEPEKVELWKTKQQWLKAKNAREAYQNGAWAYDKIKALCELHTRPVIGTDLDTLNYQQFAMKYEVV